MPRLLSGRIYRLPSGMRLVARQMVENGRFDLLSTNDLMWNSHEGAYKAERDGRISHNGNPTVWRTTDLIDTGVDVPRLAAGA